MRTSALLSGEACSASARRRRAEWQGLTGATETLGAPCRTLVSLLTPPPVLHAGASGQRSGGLQRRSRGKEEWNQTHRPRNCSSPESVLRPRNLLRCRFHHRSINPRPPAPDRTETDDFIESEQGIVGNIARNEGRYF